MTTKRRLFKRNGCVWLDGEPICLVIDQTKTANQLLYDYCRGQREYIQRLTTTVDKIESYFKQNPNAS